MTSQANVRHLLELAYAQHRGSKAQARRKPGRPSLPKAAELRYAKALRGMVAKFGEVTKAETAGVVASLPTEERKDAADGSFDVRSLREKIAAIVEETISAGIVRSVLGMVDDHSLADVSRVLGIGPELLVPGLADAMDVWRRENVQLIRSIGADYLAEVERVVTIATTQGIRAEALAQHLEERLGVASSRAELIAVDQVLKANSQLARERYQRVGITSYRWSTSRDERVRTDHKRLGDMSDAGHVFRFDDPPVVDERTGARGNPGTHFRCRCVAIAVLDD